MLKELVYPHFLKNMMERSFHFPITRIGTDFSCSLRTHLVGVYVLELQKFNF